ncbi:DUF2461 domain-containing protein [Christensenella intestinihominis]|uniref:DUF2461 domain-containing protein n=1 Tax=Christensenella intestinihominis TaxID=1851429 RepID=UPI0008316361|nr:DUF2461 domain-containing protein [Christensenella intestinihominis]
MPISKQTLDFLAQNKFNNSREWFHAHKPEYQEYVLAPMAELVELLAPAMLKIDPRLITEPKVGKAISRIYRDTRFSHDKSLYREVMWIVFSRGKKEFGCPPGFVLEFSPQGFRYGCGYYGAPPRTMEMIRKMALQGDKSFKKAFQVMKKQDVFVLEGDFYKRSKCPDAPEDLRNWLDRKNLDWMRNSTDAGLLFSPDLFKTLAEGFTLLAPFYAFLCKVEERLLTEA